MHSDIQTGKVSYAEVCAVPTPAATLTYEPVPYSVMLDLIGNCARNQGMNIDLQKAEFGLARNGQRMFGYVNLENMNHFDNQVGMALGFRASHDKSLKVDICFGTRVFVCDNMAFTSYSGEGIIANKIYHKHTSGVFSTLPERINIALSEAVQYKSFHEKFYGRLAEVNLNDTEAYATVVRAMRAEAITNNDVPVVADEWDYQGNPPIIEARPWHKEFMPRNAWSLFNAFTEIHKDYQSKNPVEASKRSIRLSEFFLNEFAAN